MGKLYVVATPIGNLGDITVRALDILKSVDLIATEDSRVTAKLLQHYQITTPTTSFHQHSQYKIAGLVNNLKAGKNIALVTDAGTPGIQDPAGELVQFARANDIEVIALPGASALTAALSIAGVPTDQFIFLGFLPKKKGRETLFTNWRDNWSLPVLIYESPNRVIRTLTDIQKFLGDRSVIIFRELTKKFEEVQTGTITAILEHFNQHPPKEEFVIMILPLAKKHGRKESK